MLEKVIWAVASILISAIGSMLMLFPVIKWRVAQVEKVNEDQQKKIENLEKKVNAEAKMASDRFAETLEKISENFARSMETNNGSFQRIHERLDQNSKEFLAFANGMQRDFVSKDSCKARHSA